MAETLPVDVLIFGGGVAGLWTLATLRDHGVAALLVESNRLGEGQTVSAQGILHGGIKYTLSGAMNDSARAHRDAPALWHRSLRAEAQPSLAQTTVLTEHCYLWRTSALSSIAGMVGARAGLATKPIKLAPGERPRVLSQCPGEVFRVDEWVIDPVSMVANLSQPHAGAIIRAKGLPQVAMDGEHITRVELTDPAGHHLAIQPRHILLTAGRGNASLRQAMGLANEVTQKRPLHMLMMRGDLPDLYGHCVDGAHTRATITSGKARDGQTVWQVGGQVSEDGVDMDINQLLTHGKREIEAVLPGIDLSDITWSAYRVDRAEASNRFGRKPDSSTLRRDGNVLTAFPTKLVLAPYLAAMVLEAIDPTDNDKQRSADMQAELASALADWQRPDVACAPWDEDVPWTRL
ncbi:FAD-dependent oxidoreductase [Mucisphaera sp.]|uniref:FAD-dependent oxidoreductase n=1 Tax=Mucisphaera sp. TaxID=2913024 RepID=UPI003D0A66FB